MLLSNADKIKFNLLYMENSHRDLAVIFDTDIRNIHRVAKEMGIFVEDYRKGIKLNYIDKKTTP